jgi:hypothetical protein
MMISKLSCNPMTFCFSRKGILTSGERPFSSVSEKIKRIAPGLILILDALTPNEQCELAKRTFELGERSDKGFWRIGFGGQREFNSRPYRGRMYERLTMFPILDVCAKVLEQGENFDVSLKSPLPTHVIALCYQNSVNPPRIGYIPWHMDNGENDGLEQFPIVSFSIGLDCNFLVRPYGKLPLRSDENEKSEVNIRLPSGSCLIMGGKSRYVWHAIKHMHADTTPDYLPDFLKDKRLNFTCRHTPHLFGLEDRFATKSAEELKLLKEGENPFYNLSAMKFTKE